MWVLNLKTDVPTSLISKKGYFFLRLGDPFLVSHHCSLNDFSRSRVQRRGLMHYSCNAESGLSHNAIVVGSHDCYECRGVYPRVFILPEEFLQNW